MKQKRFGFTLIELLVVIAIIALLLSIIMPALNTVKQIAAYATCMANQKGLATCWILYSEDNNGSIVGGSTYRSSSSDLRPSPYRWVERPQANDEYNGTALYTDDEYTLETRKNGIRAGKLFTYSENEKLYHCVADKRNVKNDEPYAKYRSYSIQGLMNSEDYETRSNEFTKITGYKQLKYTTPTSEAKMAEKVADIVMPAVKYVFVEEIEDTQRYLLGGWVLLNDGDFAWWDTPADFHNDGSTFGFADGHAEKYKWKDKDTLEVINEGTDLHPDENIDLRWLVQGYIPKK